MALALALPLLGSAILVSVQPVAREMSVTPEGPVFMRVDAPAGAAADVAKRIKDEYSQDVRAARVVGRDAALADLRADALLDHLGRHLARTETLDADGLPAARS
ncbi:hypothetical protein G6F57_023362 [Rhizopus arrhizus]|nr:hypothetical protein G6F57_023362 [Rhizopus arrhizus]